MTQAITSFPSVATRHLPRNGIQKCHWLFLLVALLVIHGTRLWAAPLIFNSTESATPGDLIYLQGDNFTTGAQVWVHLVLPTDTSLVPDVQLTPLLTNTNQEITVRLTKALPLGLYAVWVKDPSSNLSTPVFINRARAMSFEFAEVPPGYTFRIFGRNLVLPRSSPTVTFVSGTNSYPATVVTTYPNDPYVLQVTAPATLPTSGTFTVKVSNGYGHNASLANPFDVTPSEQTIAARSGGTDVFNLGVPWGPDFANIAADVINVVTSTNPHTGLAYGADPTGAANSINAIQQAIYDAGNPALHPNGATVYLPAGTFLINHSGEAMTFIGSAGVTINQPAYVEIQLPGHVVVKGAGVTSTTINDATSGMPYPNRAMNYIPNSSLQGLLDFTYNQTASVTSTTPPPIFVLVASEVFCSNVNFNFGFSAPPNAQCGSFSMGQGGCHNLLAQNINMDHGLFAVDATVGLATYAVVRNNTLTHHGPYYRERILISGIQNILFENNHCTRDGLWPGTGTSCYEQGGVETGHPPCATVLNNTFDAVNTPLSYNNDGETVLTQDLPPNGADLGTASAATSTTLTDATKAWPVNYFIGQTVRITSGTGSGESGTVTANTATTLTVGTAWTTIPNTTSKYSLAVTPYDFGTVSSATSTTLTGSSSSGVGTYWPVSGTGLAGQVVAIVNGPGTGQWRTIASNTANTLTVTTPWAEIPTSSSTYSVGGYWADRLLVKGNIFRDQPRGISIYTGSHDCAVVDNILENTGNTIYIRSDQRNTLASGWYGRMNLSWSDVVADNAVLDTTGTWASTVSASLYQTTGSALAGSLVLGVEFRRNVLLSDFANQTDSAIGMKEGYNTWGLDSNQTFTERNIPGLLGTIFDANESVNTATTNTNSPAYLNTDTYYTAFQNQLNLGTFTLTPLPYSNATLPGASHASVGTTWNVDPIVLQAGFKGSTGSTGGATDMFDTGAMGTLTAGTGTCSIAIVSNAPLTSTSGAYLECNRGTSGNPGHVNVTPTTTGTSWGRIFDFRTGQWLVNGGYDFFVRPHATPSSGFMRPLDISNNDSAHGLRLTFAAVTASELRAEIITGTGGGGVTLYGNYPGGFIAGQIYHIGVTFSTNPATGVTTEKIFAVAGTGAIDTSTTTNQLGTTTFTLNPAVLDDTGGFLSGGLWSFGDAPDLTNSVTNDYDSFRLWWTDPGIFPAL